MEIRSYRSVFDLERRIYRIDRIRLNPAGVPARGVVYFIALALVVAIFGALPGPGLLLRLVPWYLREVALPGALAAVLVIVRVDGRPFHLAAGTLSRFLISPRRLRGWTPYRESAASWRPGPVLVLPDGSEPRSRRLRYVGPGAVRVNVACKLRESRRAGVLPIVRAPRLLFTALDGEPLSKPKLVELGMRATFAVLRCGRRLH